MKLLDLHIQGFGKFQDQSLSFEDGLNVIYGKNEAGKSTIHTFIRGMLYGIERGRGRAARNDLYSKYEPWGSAQSYEGVLRLESNGMVYRIERGFHKNNRVFTIVNETAGREEEPTRILMEQLTCGLSETAYNNTISIGQLKSATDESMVTELKNYIANLNTTGNMALNITKASEYLKKQRKALDEKTVPEAARAYTSLLSEIRNLEKEISSPKYSSQVAELKKNLEDYRHEISQKQKEKESILQKIAKAREILAGSQFPSQEAIAAYKDEVKNTYDHFLKENAVCRKKSGKVMMVISLILGALLLGGGGALTALGLTNSLRAYDLPISLTITGGVFAFTSLFMFLISFILGRRSRNHKKMMAHSQKQLEEILDKHLDSPVISEEAMTALYARLDEYTRLNDVSCRSEEMVLSLSVEIESLTSRVEACGKNIEEQQRLQWELEQKYQTLSEYKDQAEGYKSVLAENERLREEIAAIDLALETMTSLSTSIRGSFGLYLNKTASSLISGITGGIYNSMSVDENLGVWLNTRTKLIPIDQISSGTMDQVYLALRLAAAKLIQNHIDEMPLIFDDSFVQYDDDRLKTALKWLSKAYHGQILIFTCHQREAQMLTANQIPYQLIQI